MHAVACSFLGLANVCHAKIPERNFSVCRGRDQNDEPSPFSAPLTHLRPCCFRSAPAHQKTLDFQRFSAQDSLFTHGLLEILGSTACKASSLKSVNNAWLQASKCRYNQHIRKAADAVNVNGRFLITHRLQMGSTCCTKQSIS